MYALAWHLRTTPEALEQRLSAQAFTRWQLWLHTEQATPAYQAIRHAQLLAALHNGPMVRKDKQPFTPADFWRDPWAPESASEPDTFTAADEEASLISAFERAWGPED